MALENSQMYGIRKKWFHGPIWGHFCLKCAHFANISSHRLEYWANVLSKMHWFTLSPVRERVYDI